MGKETINVGLVADSNPPELHLTDSEGHSVDGGNLTTTVKHKDKVIWDIVSKSGISAITISKKASSQDIFSKDPAVQPDGSWKGTISDTASGEESYNIGYTVNNVNYVCDPILQIKT